MNLSLPARLLALSFLFSLKSFAATQPLENIVSLQQAQIAKQQEQIKKLIADTESMKVDLGTCKNSDAKQKWTEGSMCVLANGSCPAGFSRSEGHIRAMSIYVDQNNANSYLSPVGFGSSSISWHGGAPYQYGTWAGELNLVACCK